MVAREGVAPPISGCRPDVILFHYRALKLAAGNGIAPLTSLSKSDELLVTPSRSRKWWLARVMRPVLRIKSPLHHFNACEPKLIWRSERRGCEEGPWKAAARSGLDGQRRAPRRKRGSGDVCTLDGCGDSIGLVTLAARRGRRALPFTGICGGCGSGCGGFGRWRRCVVFGASAGIFGSAGRPGFFRRC